MEPIIPPSNKSVKKKVAEQKIQFPFVLPENDNGMDLSDDDKEENARRIMISREI